MYHGLSHNHEHTNTQQPSPLPPQPLPHHDSNHSSPPLSPTPSSSLPHEPYHCTICRDTSQLTLQTQIPSCHHSFCLACVLSWTKVREICPNCKTSFTYLLVHRDLTGAIVPGPFTARGTPPWIRESIALLQRVEWVQAREVFPPIHDLESSFTLPPISSPSSAVVASSPFSPAPHYLHEEFEDELESRFWEEEEKQFDRLMGSRVMSNRRFGANGYISAGRLRATPCPLPRTHKQSAASSAAGPSAAHSARAEEVSKRRERERKSGQANASSSGGGRKKKLKKKSREGMAQAARKKAEAEAAAATAVVATAATAAAATSTASATAAVAVSPTASVAAAVAATDAAAEGFAPAECTLSETNASSNTPTTAKAGSATAAST